MNLEEFRKFFNGEGEFNYDYISDYALKGLQIISKYCNEVVVACEHDILYSVEIKDICYKITNEDAAILRDLGWGIDEDNDHFFCYV